MLKKRRDLEIKIKIKMKHFLIFLTFLVGHSCQSDCQTLSKLISTAIDMKDVEKSYNMLELLKNEDKNIVQKSINDVLSNPNIYNPTVTYMLSILLFDQDKKNEAMFWFYLSQVRTRVDSNICKDISARKGVGILNLTYGQALNKMAFSNLDTLKAVVEKVVAFAQANEESYDRRWINLYGNHAEISELQDESKQNELSEPIAKWADIKKTTLESYYSDFIKYVIKKEK
jgi:hypothetical protein